MYICLLQRYLTYKHNCASEVGCMLGKATHIHHHLLYMTDFIWPNFSVVALRRHTCNPINISGNEYLVFASHSKIRVILL